MSSISVRLPESLHKKARDLAKKEKTSINQLVSSALAEKISALSAEEYIELRAKRASKEKFRKALSKVKNAEPDELNGK
ncbi:MAG: type II toxin-antitoxin system HicB family antitoxin [Bacteroidetes bacterium]|nr:type II toxin-antitoxin system HicB family antitoxin [Bacteroidota bacterium]